MIMENKWLWIPHYRENLWVHPHLPFVTRACTSCTQVYTMYRPTSCISVYIVYTCVHHVHLCTPCTPVYTCVHRVHLCTPCTPVYIVYTCVHDVHQYTFAVPLCGNLSQALGAVAYWAVMATAQLRESCGYCRWEARQRLHNLHQVIRSAGETSPYLKWVRSHIIRHLKWE